MMRFYISKQKYQGRTNLSIRIGMLFIYLMWGPPNRNR